MESYWMSDGFILDLYLNSVGCLIDIVMDVCWISDGMSVEFYLFSV